MARILAVDDEPLVRRAVSRVMNRLGHTVAEAADGNAAIRMMQETAYDVAFVDYDMPGGPDGLAVLSRLRDLCPRCVRVLMTGRTDFPVVVEAINKGEVLRVLPKPFHAEQLESLLDDVVVAARRLAAVAESQTDVSGAGRLFQELLDGDQLSMAVQPIVAGPETSRVVAVECLLRSAHPVLASPLSILHTVERATRVWDLGARVNQLAARWVDRLPPEVLIFVNVHPAQLDDPAVEARFAALAPYAPRVVLEITERASLRDFTNWEGSIARLEALGFRFALDDLGSGYGGLSLLADLRPAFIKLDMSIVRDVHKKPHKQRLVDLLLTFANATGAVLVAEGVETEEEAEALVRIGTHLLQGYYFARPSMTWPMLAG
ncbi:MAG: EAL domain-containing protein [Pseudomonadota bacterium]|nr:EAL domain-containing protein [Pseudomonadota bacterium]